MIPIGYNVWEMYGKSLLFSPRNVHFTLSKMTIANQTQLTSICFGCDRAALSASSLVGELSVTLRDLPHTLFGSLASTVTTHPIEGRHFIFLFFYFLFFFALRFS